MNGNRLFNFFAYLKDGNVKRIPLIRELQMRLTQGFAEKLSVYISNETTLLDFNENVHYNPDEDELFVIKNFRMPQKIINALNNPVNLENISEEYYENIRAIFCGGQNNENYEIMFTVFDSKKIIKRSRFKIILLYRDGTFTDFENKMIVIEERIDVLFRNNNLYFRSFTNAKKIFGDHLNEYYREATDEEIEEFSDQLFGDSIPNEFIDYRTRKFIFGIMKEGIPEVRRVVQVGKEKFGIELEITEDGKLAIPDNKRDFKKLLKLLNDDLLESPLTNAKYETNSKRKIS